MKRLLFMILLIAVSASSQDKASPETNNNKNSDHISLPEREGPGKGKHIVLLAGDEEYRCINGESPTSWTTWSGQCGNAALLAPPSTRQAYDPNICPVGGGGGSCTWALNETDDCAANPNVCQSPACGSASDRARSPVNLC